MMADEAAHERYQPQHVRRGELAPQNSIERMWVRDIARLTIRSEELRHVIIAVHKTLMARSAKQIGLNLGCRTNETSTSPAIPVRTCDQAQSETQLERLLGVTYADHLQLVAGLESLEAAVRRDRDRVIGEFDRRRSAMLQDMLDALTDAGLD